MSDTKRKIKKLEQEIHDLREQYMSAEKRCDTDSMENLENEIQAKYKSINYWETEQLKALARKYDIVIPRDNKGWWWSDPDFPGSPADAPDMLTDVGRAGALKLIKEERRANHDWWIKTLTLILGALTGLTGAITGALAVYYSNTNKPKPEQPAVLAPSNITNKE